MKKLCSLILGLILSTGLYAQTGIPSIRSLTNPSSLSSAASYMSSVPTSQLQMLGIDPSALSSVLGGVSTGSPTTTNTPKNNQNSTSANLSASGLTPDMIQQILMVQNMLSSQMNLDSIKEAGVNDYLLSNDTAIHKPSKYFGHDYFNSARIKLFERSTELKATDDYVLDAGDELNISVWGNAEYNDNAKIGKDGFISIPQVGRIYLRGQSFAAAKSLIRSRVSNFVNLSNSTLEISLNYSRSLTVNIVGEVYRPGTFEIPAINSVFNALNAAEGITDLGSVRNIEIRRGGKTVKTFDMYEFLLNPFIKDNFYLQEGDFIYVPTAKRIVQVEGNVRRPKYYELKDNENVADLLRYAGGLTANAFTASVQLKRYTNNKSEITDYNLDDILSGKTPVVLKDGDKLTIPQIPEDVDNYITIVGTVKLPGKYELKEGYRISDLIKISGGLLYNTYIERAYLIRQLDNLQTTIQPFSLQDIIINEGSPENVILKAYDRIEIFPKELFKEKFSVSIEGSVKTPVKMEYSEGMKLNDLIFYAGGLKNEAANNKIEISRVTNINETDGTSMPTRVVVLTAEIGPNLELDAATKAFELNPMDQVFVRKTFEFDLQQNVTINGEVKFPGVYPILRKDEKILDLILRAGGYTNFAAPDEATLYRKDSKIGIVILNLKDAMEDTASTANFILKEGDVITIPTTDQLVRIQGAIRYPDLDSLETIAGRYVPGKRAKWYVKKYGIGFSSRAKRKSTVALYPNGGADYTKFKFFYREFPQVKPGSLITVGYKPIKVEEEKPPREPINWNIVLPAIITSVASAASTTVLYFLLRGN